MFNDWIGSAHQVVSAELNAEKGQKTMPLTAMSMVKFDTRASHRLAIWTFHYSVNQLLPFLLAQLGSKKGYYKSSLDHDANGSCFRHVTLTHYD
jgi:hypothetical protein